MSVTANWATIKSIDRRKCVKSYSIIIRIDSSKKMARDDWWPDEMSIVSRKTSYKKEAPDPLVTFEYVVKNSFTFEPCGGGCLNWMKARWKQKENDGLWVKIN